MKILSIFHDSLIYYKFKQNVYMKNFYIDKNNFTTC